MLVFASGCGDEKAAGVSSQYSVITGLVTDNPGTYISKRDYHGARPKEVASPIQGATVVAMWVQPGGTPEAISDTTETNANGKFSLTCDVTDINNAIVVATKGSTVTEAIVGATLTLGGTEYCQPIDEQTTIQAELYTGLVGSSNLESGTYPDIVFLVSEPVAAAAESDTADIEQLASAITAGENAWINAMENSSVGNVAAGTTDQINLSRIKAEQSFESSLYSDGENTALAKTAFINYLRADQNSYLISGVSPEAVAEIATVQARAELNALSNSNSILRFAVKRQTSLVSAIMMTSAIDTSLELLFPPQTTLDSATIAGHNLAANLENSTTTAEIDSAFESYHGTILRLTAKALGGLVGLQVAAIDADISAANGPRAALLSVSTLQLPPGDLVRTYAAFFQEVNSEVKSELTGLPTFEVSSIASILTLTNME